MGSASLSATSPNNRFPPFSNLSLPHQVHLHLFVSPAVGLFHGIHTYIDDVSFDASAYIIGYAISVSKDELRKYLESQGIIKALSEGF